MSINNINDQFFDKKHPFLQWLSFCYKLNEVSFLNEGKDIFMGDSISRRFAFGIEDSNTPFIASYKDEYKIFSEIKWNSVYFLRNNFKTTKTLKNTDWIVFFCPSFSVNNSVKVNNNGFRVFIKIKQSIFDQMNDMFKDAEVPKRLVFSECDKVNNKPVYNESNKNKLFLLYFKGEWDFLK